MMLLLLYTLIMLIAKSDGKEKCTNQRMIDTCLGQDPLAVCYLNGKDPRTGRLRIACACPEDYQGKPGVKPCVYSPACSSHDECENGEACRGGSCVDVCTNEYCGGESCCSARGTCIGEEHQAVCQCPPGMTGFAGRDEDTCEIRDGSSEVTDEPPISEEESNEPDLSTEEPFPEEPEPVEPITDEPEPEATTSKFSERPCPLCNEKPCCFGPGSKCRVYEDGSPEGQADCYCPDGLTGNPFKACYPVNNVG